MAVSFVYSTTVSSLFKHEESDKVAATSAKKLKIYFSFYPIFLFSCKFTENSLKNRPFLLIIMQFIDFRGIFYIF